MASNVVRAAKLPAEGPRRRARSASTHARPAAVTQPAAARDWRRAFARRLLVSDLAVLSAVVFGTQLLWFGWVDTSVSLREDSRLSEIPYWAFSVALVAVWMWSLALIDSRSDRTVGTGATEYIRVISGSVRLFGMIAILAFLLRVDVARGYLLLSFPIGVAALMLERWSWRQWLVAKRRKGEYCAKVLLVGSAPSVAQIGAALGRARSAGYVVVGACVPRGEPGTAVPGSDIPIVGDIFDVRAGLAASGADTVAITNTDELPPSGVKRISWELEAGREHLVLAPSITDVVGPRLQARPVAGLPLIHVETPQYTRGQRFAKRLTDVFLAGVGLVILTPLMVVISLMIRSSSSGPVLFAQTRIGLDGRQFRMWKFRTMVNNAEELLPGLADQRDRGNEVLFKMSADPRVTPVGRFLRRFSLDELPQLFNVLAGSMSVVGPRPPLPREVQQYADHVHRRFLVKPGITGLWQVSGRSTLSWEESVRLDLSYVENWTLAGDLVILLKTVRAALFPQNTAF